MRFLHVADLHIGKVVNEFSMLEDQAYILDQIAGLAVERKVDAVVAAGDLYDRSIPPAPAVILLDRFLDKLSAEGIPVIAVSGNHDSPERLNFASSMLEKQGVYLAGIYQGKVREAVLQDQWGDVAFFLLPYLRPSVVNDCLGTGCKSFQEAAEAVLEGLPERKGRRVLVAHQFVAAAGQPPELSDSEMPLSVGGTELVDAALFQGFDYVALGHLHRCQRVGQGPVYYAGSPLKYSKSEVNGRKYALLVEMDGDGRVEVKKEELRPLRDMRCIRGPLKELIREEVAALGNREDYLFVTLTDKGELLDPMRTLRGVYPNTMQAERETGRRILQDRATDAGPAKTERPGPVELFRQFYSYAFRGEEMDEEQTAALRKVLDEMGGEAE